jgi:hypothetical protein
VRASARAFVWRARRIAPDPFIILRSHWFCGAQDIADTAFAALLLAKAGVAFERLDKIYEYFIRMGDWRHGTDYHPGGRFDFVRLQENP